MYSVLTAQPICRQWSGVVDVITWLGRSKLPIAIDAAGAIILVSYRIFAQTCKVAWLMHIFCGLGCVNILC